MLDDTLVVWTTEFGRHQASTERKAGAITALLLSSWLAGGGSRGGVAYGTTDGIGSHCG